jgi:hypothetical protein
VSILGRLARHTYEEKQMPVLESTDLDRAREYFDRTFHSIMKVTNGLSEPQWRFKPAPDRWSITEILEHMVLAEERILGPIREQLAQAPPPEAGRDNRAIDAMVLERMPETSPKVNAPAVIQPAGGWTLDAALTRLISNYRRLVEFIKSTPDLREHVLPAAPIKFLSQGKFETMDGYQFALTMAAHDARHVRQILELKADPNYPSTETAEATAVA